MPLTLISGPVIAAGESLSSVLDGSASNTGIARITMPAEWDQAAWLTFQISHDGATFTELVWPNGAPVVVTVVPGSTVVTDPRSWDTGFYKFRSGSAEHPIAQTATRNFTTVMS